MQTYPLRRGWAKRLSGAQLRDLVAEVFGSASLDGEKVTASYGALEQLTVWTDGKSLFVDTRMTTAVDDATAVATRKAWNGFLERATGYNAKQRSQRAQKEAKAGAPDAEA